MGRISKAISENFTAVHNEFLQDRSLNLVERGMLMTLLQLPDDWNFSIAGLQSILPDGNYRISHSLTSLQEKGYFRRIKVINKNTGLVVDWIYEFSDEVHSEWKREAELVRYIDGDTVENPYSDFPNVDSPHMDNQAQSNTNKSNTDKYDYDNDIDGAVDDKNKEIFIRYLTTVKAAIDYEALCDKHSKYTVDNIVDIVVNTLISTAKTIRVGKKSINSEIVKERLLNLTFRAVDNVINRTAGRSIYDYRAYIITALNEAAMNNGAVSVEADEYKVYSSDELVFYARACDCLFDNSQMHYINSLLISIIPYCNNASDRSIETERYNYLRRKYLYVAAKGVRKRNRFGYLSKILENESKEKKDVSYSSSSKHKTENTHSYDLEELVRYSIENVPKVNWIKDDKKEAAE